MVSEWFEQVGATGHDVTVDILPPMAQVRGTIGHIETPSQIGFRQHFS